MDCIGKATQDEPRVRPGQRPFLGFCFSWTCSFCPGFAWSWMVTYKLKETPFLLKLLLFSVFVTAVESKAGHWPGLSEEKPYFCVRTAFEVWTVF